MPLLNRTPEKYEAKALEYERKAKPMKAMKYREKALRLRSGNTVYPTTQLGGLGTQQSTFVSSPILAQPTSTFTQSPILGQTGFSQGGLQQGGLLGQQGGFNQWQGWQSSRNPAIYETNALKWEQRGNWAKAQKNREKYWRTQNPQYSNFAAPTFYNNNKFLGYNQPYGAPFNNNLNNTGLNSGLGLGQTGLAGQTGLGLGQTALAGQQTGLGLGQTGLAGQQLGGITSLQKGSAITNAPIVEQIVRPTIVQETLRPERIVQVQPIVHREIDAPQVRVIEKHVYETVPSMGPSTITNAPIVQETVRPKIIEEVQPVVHRTVPAPFVERVEQHVTEHIVQPTTTTKEVINGGLVQQPFVAAGGAPITQQTTTTTTTTQQGGLMSKVNNVLHRNQQQSM